jgi:hypothetical protein
VSNELRFDEQVAVITGAASSLELLGQNAVISPDQSTGAQGLSS